MYYNKNKSKNIITLLSTQLLGGLMLLAVLGGCGGGRSQEEDSSPSTNTAELAAAHKKYINAVGGADALEPKDILEGYQAYLGSQTQGQEKGFARFLDKLRIDKKLLSKLKELKKKKPGSSSATDNAAPILEDKGYTGHYKTYVEALATQLPLPSGKSTSSKERENNRLRAFLEFKGLEFVQAAREAASPDGEADESKLSKAKQAFDSTLEDLKNKKTFMNKDDNWFGPKGKGGNWKELAALEDPVRQIAIVLTGSVQTAFDEYKKTVAKIKQEEQQKK